MTGFEFGRGEGRDRNSLNVLDWDIERIRSHLVRNDQSVSGLESLLKEIHDLESELKFLQAVPGAIVEERKALQARRKKIKQLIRELTESIEKIKQIGKGKGELVKVRISRAKKCGKGK